MSPELPLRFARQCVVAADILERYVSIGYVADITQCIAGIGSVLPLDDIMRRSEQIRAKARPIERLIQPSKSRRLDNESRQRRREPPEKQLGEELSPEAGGQQTEEMPEGNSDDATAISADQYGSRPERASLILAMGHEFVLLPLARLCEMVSWNIDYTGHALRYGLFDDNVYTGADATARIVYRWYVKSDTEVESRFMARSLELRAGAALDLLERLNVSGELMRRRRRLGGDDNWLHFEGVLGSSDLRLTGGSKGIVEMVVRSESYEHGLVLMSSIVDAVGQAADEPTEEVVGVVASRLHAIR